MCPVRTVPNGTLYIQYPRPVRYLTVPYIYTAVHLRTPTLPYTSVHCCIPAVHPPYTVRTPATPAVHHPYSLLHLLYSLRTPPYTTDCCPSYTVYLRTPLVLPCKLVNPYRTGANTDLRPPNPTGTDSSAPSVHRLVYR